DGLSRWHRGQVTTYRTPGNVSARAERRGAESGGGREIFDSGLPDDGVGHLAEDGNGRLWVSTLRGVAYLDNGRFTPLHQLPGGRISSMAVDGAGDLWLVNEVHGLYRLRDATVVEQISWGTLKLDD